MVGIASSAFCAHSLDHQILCLLSICLFFLLELHVYFFLFPSLFSYRSKVTFYFANCVLVFLFGREERSDAIENASISTLRLFSQLPSDLRKSEKNRHRELTPKTQNASEHICEGTDVARSHLHSCEGRFCLLFCAKQYPTCLTKRSSSVSAFS